MSKGSKGLAKNTPVGKRHQKVSGSLALLLSINESQKVTGQQLGQRTKSRGLRASRRDRVS